MSTNMYYMTDLYNNIVIAQISLGQAMSLVKYLELQASPNDTKWSLWPCYTRPEDKPTKPSHIHDPTVNRFIINQTIQG